jgi:hypothetical protein
MSAGRLTTLIEGSGGGSVPRNQTTLYMLFRLGRRGGLR